MQSKDKEKIEKHSKQFTLCKNLIRNMLAIFITLIFFLNFSKKKHLYRKQYWYGTANNGKCAFLKKIEIESYEDLN